MTFNLPNWALVVHFINGTYLMATDNTLFEIKTMPGTTSFYVGQDNLREIYLFDKVGNFVGLSRNVVFNADHIFLVVSNISNYAA